tara:strand:+ start:648 stop:1298 length:651 start_codon:yes stop_codon:yes gene_type:complete
LKYRFNRFLHENIIFQFKSKNDVFTSIWKNNYWGDAESLSGPGSTIEYTEEIRIKLPTMLLEKDIISIFDAPCGDFNWMRYIVKENSVEYLGGDIVDELIQENKKKYASKHIKFRKFDLTSDTFPEADVWLARAVFYHLSNREIYQALEQFVSSNIKYLLTTNHITDASHVNRDIKTGDWRLLNLCLPPFNFSKEPLWEINDYIEPSSCNIIFMDT